MKTLRTSLRVVLAALVVFGLGMLAAPVQADVLIQVNVSNPAAVTFTATGNFSAVDDSSFTYIDGLDLVLFFAGGGPGFGGGGGPVAGDLALPDLPDNVYEIWSNDARDGGDNWVDLNLYRGSDSTTQVFYVTAPAFTGTATIDMSLVAGFLPTPGSSGDIVPGYASQTPYPVIGQWEVVAVPEPATLSLLALGGLALIRRRRK